MSAAPLLPPDPVISTPTPAPETHIPPAAHFLHHLAIARYWANRLERMGSPAICLDIIIPPAHARAAYAEASANAVGWASK